MHWDKHYSLTNDNENTAIAFSPDWRAGGAQQAVYANRCYVTYSIPTFRPSVIPQLAHFEYERVWKVMHRISGATSACDSSMAERSIYLDRRF